MKSENLVWLVASQQTQHDYCNDCISCHCNYLLKLLLGTLIAICSLSRFERVEWWTSARRTEGPAGPAGNARCMVTEWTPHTGQDCAAFLGSQYVIFTWKAFQLSSISLKKMSEKWWFSKRTCNMILCVWGTLGKNACVPLPLQCIIPTPLKGMRIQLPHYFLSVHFSPSSLVSPNQATTHCPWIWKR